MPCDFHESPSFLRSMPVMPASIMATPSSALTHRTLLRPRMSRDTIGRESTSWQPTRNVSRYESSSCHADYFVDINLSVAIRSHQVLGWALCGRGHIGPSTNGDYAKSQAVVIGHGCAQQGLQGQERLFAVKGDAKCKR